VVTTYDTYNYTDKDGKEQRQDVVANTISTTTTCVGAANPTRWKSKLEAGSPAFPGALLIKRTETFNFYIATDEGPVESTVITNEYEPRISFAGGLAIENYKNIDLGVGNILLRKTIVEKEQNKAADLTKQTTILYQAWGATAAGKTVAATIMAALKRSNETIRIDGTYTLVNRMSSLICTGVEKTINIGRGIAPAQPSPLDQQNQNLGGTQEGLSTNGGWNVNGPLGNQNQSKLTTLSFDSNAAGANPPFSMAAGSSLRTGKYSMRFAPDSYLRPSAGAGDNNTGLEYVYASTATAAYDYGKAVHYILSGMANGKSITTELRNLPSEPMGTLYLEAAGTVGKFRANGTTFAWDSQGLVVGCDAMLDGGAGLVANATGADWFPMMVSAANLPTVTTTSNNTPGLANTINAPTGFDPMAPGNVWASFGTAGVESDVYAVELSRTNAVGAVAETVRRESVSRSLSWLLDAPYSVSASTVSLTSVTTNYGTIATPLFAGSGSGAFTVQAAVSPMLSFTSGTSMTWSAVGSGGGVMYGYSFTLASAKQVKGVGFYDAGGDGLQDSIKVFVIDLSGAWNGVDAVPLDDSITDIPVTAGTGQPLNGVWRVNMFPGNTLQPGTYGLLAWLADVVGTSSVSMIKNATGLTSLSGVTINGPLAYNFDYPYGAISTTGDGPGYFGPVLFFEG